MERLEKLRDHSLCRDHHEHVVDEELRVEIGIMIGALERVATKVEELRNTQNLVRFLPYAEAVPLLNGEKHLLITVAKGGE